MLFALHPLLEARSDNPRIEPLFDNAGDHIYWGSGVPSYEALSVADRPAPAALREADSGFSPARSYYTQLPPLPQRVGNLADSLTQGLDNNYDKVTAINDFFHTDFDYTLELPRSAQQATLDYFLFERGEGHCEYFSTAMVVRLRSLGVHAREVNGFLGGQWNEFGQYLCRDTKRGPLLGGGLVPRVRVGPVRPDPHRRRNVRGGHVMVMARPLPVRRTPAPME